MQFAVAGAFLGSGPATAQQRSASRVAAGGHIDGDWFRNVLAQETERSLKTIVTPSGFLGGPGRGGQKGGAPLSQGSYRPTGLGTGTPTSQGRNLFVLAAGYDLTRKPEFLEAVTKAADFMLTHFRDKQYGGLFGQVDPEGKVLDDRKESYGTAHAIMGLSHAARVTQRKAYGDAALEIWSEMKRGLRDQHGLFKRETSRDFKVAGPGKNTQNPMMHLFEGLLALHDATNSKLVFEDARSFADNVLARLYREPGYIPELYDSEWKPIPVGPPGQTEPDGSPLDVYNAYAAAAQTGHVEVGHQIEWAFFLSRAVEKGFPRKYLGPAERFVDYAMKVGYDRQTGGVFGYADYDGKPTAASATTGWQIAEFLKMLMNWAVLRNRQDLWAPFEKSLAAVKSGTQLPGGYHGCGMYVEAVRLAKA
jgi:mannose/cellobiose epimerase-like protein (N-acyl-D-glucosamine 2-epimerase family)